MKTLTRAEKIAEYEKKHKTNKPEPRFLSSEKWGILAVRLFPHESRLTGQHFQLGFVCRTDDGKIGEVSAFSHTGGTCSIHGFDFQGFEETIEMNRLTIIGQPAVKPR